MADSIIKFHDAAERPPMGGWHYFYNTADRDTYFRKDSPGSVFDELKRFRLNNRTFVSDIDVERELWAYWCSLHPERCGQAIAPAVPVPFLPKDQTPEFFGPIIWKFLNLAATRWEQIGNAGFTAILEQVFPLMSCPTCREEWAEIVAADSPTISSTKEACEWVNRCHNRVNAKRGKEQYPYSRMVIEYGAPLP